MSHLTRIAVKGYRSLRDIDIDVSQPVNVLIGPNGAGKSNLLSALQLLSKLRTGGLEFFVSQAGGASQLLHYGASQTRTVEFQLDFETDRGHHNAYRVSLGHAAAHDRFVFLDELVGHRRAAGDSFDWISLGSGHTESKLRQAVADGPSTTLSPADHKTLQTLDFMFKRLNFFHFHDTSDSALLRSNARVSDALFLRSNGSNLAAYLHELTQSDDEDAKAAFRRIAGWVRKAAPMVRELSPTPVNGGAVRLDWVDDRGETFGSHQLSDGTLRALALLTGLGQPRSRLPIFCSIDEPELGLHPAALELLLEVADSVSAHCHLLLATQSPRVLERFGAASVIVCERVDFATRLRRLDPAELTQWLDEYTLGELFDSNLLGGRP